MRSQVNQPDKDESSTLWREGPDVSMDPLPGNGLPPIAWPRIKLDVGILGPNGPDFTGARIVAIRPGSPRRGQSSCRYGHR
jgi:hypothetical protein